MVHRALWLSPAVRWLGCRSGCHRLAGNLLIRSQMFDRPQRSAGVPRCRSRGSVTSVDIHGRPPPLQYNCGTASSEQWSRIVHMAAVPQGAHRQSRACQGGRIGLSAATGSVSRPCAGVPPACSSAHWHAQWRPAPQIHEPGQPYGVYSCKPTALRSRARDVSPLADFLRQKVEQGLRQFEAIPLRPITQTTHSTPENLPNILIESSRGY